MGGVCSNIFVVDWALRGDCRDRGNGIRRLGVPVASEYDLAERAGNVARAVHAVRLREPGA
jgi:hypothetical protein